TKESKVYFEEMTPLSIGTAGVSTAAVGVSTVTRSSWTVSCTRRSWPVVSRTAARIRPRKCPSIHSRVKSFGTATTNASSLTSTPAASPNQVRYVASFSAPWRRADTSLQRLSAVSSTPLLPSLTGHEKRREHSSVEQASQHVRTLSRQTLK